MRGAVIAFAFVTSFAATAAAAGDPKTECINAADQAQSARDDGKYRAAREAFATCARAVCPKPVAATCTKWSRELDDAMPTIVLSAKDASGSDVSAVRVTFDGAQLATVLDGKPVDVDPGSHKLRFEHEGSDPIDQTVVIRAGEKLRAVSVTFHAGASAQTTTEPKPETPKPSGGGNTAKTATTVVLSVLAVGGLVSGVALGVASQGDADSAQALRVTMPANACTINGATTPCQNLSSAVDAQNRDAAISVAMYVTAGVFAAGAVIAWLAWPKSHAAEEHADHPTFSLLVGPAFAGLRGTF